MGEGAMLFTEKLVRALAVTGYVLGNLIRSIVESGFFGDDGDAALKALAVAEKAARAARPGFATLANYEEVTAAKFALFDAADIVEDYAKIYVGVPGTQRVHRWLLSCAKQAESVAGEVYDILCDYPFN